MSNFLNSLLSQIPSLVLAGFFWQYIQEKLKKIDEIDRRVLEYELREKIKKELSQHP